MMIVRIILGIVAGYLLIAYFPLILQILPYLLPLLLCGVAFLCLRTIPALAEPLGYGLLVALLCYIAAVFLRHKGKLKELWRTRGKHKTIMLPVINVPQHPQVSAILTLVFYTIGLTFVLYLLILLIYVN